MKKILLIVICCLMGISAVWSQEFLLHDETFTWTEDADACGGFHYWYDHGNAPTMNWTSPMDYQNGYFYFRFEIINQPSNAPFRLNFCIWAELAPDYSFWRESCGTFSDELAGPGSVSTVSSHVSPAFNGGIDWTDLSKLWRYGNPLWVDGYNMGNGPYCTDHPEVWVKKDLYFPLTLRVTIVAVAAGYNFSGWNNYIGGCIPGTHPTPAYGIDFTNETTNKVVPTSDEYSYSSDMSGAITGTGTRLDLTPGQDVYFRTKASGCMSASAIQHLVVPDRPATPSFSVDFISEMTKETISSEYQYSTSSDMNGAIAGTGSKLTVTPGSNLYFIKKATSSQFASAVQTLVVPARPAAPSFSVNYVNESTAEGIPATVEYSSSSDMSAVLNGSGSVVTLLPGTNLYFRVKSTSSSFVSTIFHLPVENRPIISTTAGDTVHNEFSATINFNKEVTGFEASDIETTNANVTLTGALTIEISPVVNGDVTAKVIANAVTGGNFASELFSTYYKKIELSISNVSGSDGMLLAYPSPAGDVLHIVITRDLALPLDIMLVSSNGAVAIRESVSSTDYDIGIKEIPAGLYILKALDARGKEISYKIVKQSK